MSERDDPLYRKRKRGAPKATERISRWTHARKNQLFKIGKSLPMHDRPKTRGDCVNGIRPCPYVGCSHHLYLEVKKNGNITVSFPDITPDEMTTPSCVLDVVDSGDATLEEVGQHVNITRERVRQIEERGIKKLRKRPPGF